LNTLDLDVSKED